jgi:poly [ADP-ribose] polymerase
MSNKRGIVRENGLRYAKLIHVSVDNGKTAQSNKVYIMDEQSDGTIKCTYGRVGGHMTEVTKPSSQWDKLHDSKTNPRKGYKDKTEESVVTKAKGTLKDIEETDVKQLFDDLMAYANKSIGANYKITQNEVTQIQVDKAQEILDDAVKLARSRKTDKVKQINDKLIELYTTIPRKMKNVKDYLIEVSHNPTQKDLMAFLANEQSILDTMAGQVKAIAQTTVTDDDDDQVTLLEKMGLEVTIEDNAESVALVKKLLGQNASKMSRLFKCVNKETQERFDKHFAQAKNKKRRLYWHGSRNENWFNIIQTGLMIRPSGVVHTGSMFGDGIYFANKAQKSLGYTSLRGSYWARGGANKAYLALFDVHTGNQKDIRKHDSSCYRLSQKVLDKDGYDSVFAHGGIDLRNDELIVYSPERCTIAYIVEIID